MALPARERPELAFGLTLPRRARRPGARRARRLQPRAARAPRRSDLALALRHLVALRRRRDGELAVGVPAVHALHPRARSGCSSAARRSPRSSTRRPESDEEQKVGEHAAAGLAALGAGRRAGARALYSNSLLLVMGVDLARSWLAQSITGRAAYNAEQLDHHAGRASAGSAYVGTADFWNRTLQNWQSEFLAVGSMADARDLPAPARVAGVQAGRRAARRRPASRAESLRARRMALLELDTDQGDSRASLALRGELDIYSAPMLEEALSGASRPRPSLLVIDLRGLEFMDCTGLRTLVERRPAGARRRATSRHRARPGGGRPDLQRHASRRASRARRRSAVA